MDHKPGAGNRLQASLFPMSAVRGRHPDDLNEGIPEHYDAVHPSASKHAFEWWYFDGRFTDGHTFAGTMQGKEPQISMHINAPGGEQLDVRVNHPRDQFKGSTERCEVEGEGYHDHNWGDFNFTKYLNRWQWGRITTQELTVVFADVVTRSTCGRVHMPLLLIARGDRLAFETYEMEWHYDDYQLDSTGLQAYPRGLGFSFAERDVRGHIEFAPKHVRELDDLLKDARVPSWAEGVIGKAVAQPVYLRLDSSYEGEIDFGGEAMQVSGDTIVEYMVFTLRRGHHPHEGPYRHFLKPPKLGRLHGLG